MEKTFTRELPVTLTVDEFIAYSEELSRTLKEINELTIQRSRLNSLMKPKNERVDELVPIIDSKTVRRDVECRWTYYWEIGRRTLFRLDTYEVVEDDIIPENERQQRFQFEGEHVPGGDDARFTETDEKAQRPVEIVDEVACPKCEGAGYFIEDGVEDGVGEVYCDCPAGATRKDRDDLCNKSRGCKYEEQCFLQPLSDNMICYVDEPDQLPTAGGCPHPEEARFVESNATICGACGLVMATAPIERESQPDGEVTA